MAYSITVNRNDKRLDLFRDDALFKSYPVAVGSLLTPTPPGTFRIINKSRNPGGPYGTRWMGLSKPHIGIHGTNNPSSIGQPASHGCIRMQNHDVEELYDLVPIGTAVKII
jgi:lipoprotein-anchoring transpeptidase ErfK/SrfK